MTIGYLVEGTNDDGFVRGLAARYCPHAKLVSGRYRGSTGTSIRRELKRSMTGLFGGESRCDYVVVLRDANKENWKTVLKRETEVIPKEYRHAVLMGVASENIEDWLAADRAALAKALGCNEAEMPLERLAGWVKHQFQALAARTSPTSPVSSRVAQFVSKAPLREWLRNSESFNQFWDDVFQFSKRVDGCDIPNERN